MRLLSVLEESATAGQLVALREQDARPARVAGWPTWVSPQVKAACASHGVPHLWEHQVRAANLIHAGTHTVVATGTGSGKSLAAWVPALTEMLSPRGSGSLARVSAPPTVLYLSPTKALAADQYTSLRALARDVDSRITVAAADGDADSEEKTFARDHADIVLTNPDFVHHAMLPQKDRWQRIWRGLRMIGVDEFHSYKGLFGAHVGHVVRRILRIAALYGAHPTVVFLSATAGAPQETATRFIGTAFGTVEAVTDDASPRGERIVALWQCSPVDDDATGHVPPGEEPRPARKYQSPIPGHSLLPRLADPPS
ncbi:DEAD/DEAH box helicase, partial [Actinotignum timonense]|uniref:DEAD/DEAH box helicase n=1 Tax=Actinotignum timonense TaxID=1870995 RepID=UPI002A7ED5D8